MHNNLLLANPAGDDKLYVEDVFSTWLYTGTGASQTITNGIDLAGKGGLVWIKSRSATANNVLVDTVRGAYANLSSNLTSQSRGANTVTNFNSTGFTVTNDTSDATFMNTTGVSGTTYASWTFRKAPKFFDVVTFTYAPTAYPGKSITHNLGSTPGMIIVKSTTLGTGGGASWYVSHRATPNPYVDDLYLNSTAAAASNNGTINGVTSTSFNFIGGGTTGVTQTYVAYLFAHDTTADGVIQCGSFTGNGSTIGPTINLGWEPQFLLVKSTTETSANWLMFDNMRGLPVSGNGQQLIANSSGAEGSADRFSVTPTGFNPINGYSQSNASGQTYIYLAIRRGPMRVPTDATKVFKPVVYTGNNSVRTISAGFPPDAVWFAERTSTYWAQTATVFDRLRGRVYSVTSGTGAESDLSPFVNSLGQDGIEITNSGANNASAGANSYLDYFFRRAPGFFDVVCYTGAGAARTVSHNLGVAPELIIVKPRNNGTTTFGNWVVQSAYLTGGFASPDGHVLNLNKTNASAQQGYIYNVGSSSFTVNGSVTSGSGTNYVVYLFASCPGVSKVGSFTGNGAASQTIDCGFTNGARFVMIKRTDGVGSWYVWDSARGIISANDPYLQLNSTAAELTNSDDIDPTSVGFIVNKDQNAGLNENGWKYIYLAIA